MVDPLKCSYEKYNFFGWQKMFCLFYYDIIMDNNRNLAISQFWPNNAITRDILDGIWWLTIRWILQYLQVHWMDANQDANITDTLRRLWYGSDPIIHQERLKARSYCKHCQVHGHGTRYCSTKRSRNGFEYNDDDALFYSFVH